MKALLIVFTVLLCTTQCYTQSEQDLYICDERIQREKFAAGVAMLIISNYADYYYQADMHGWQNPLWVNGARAPKWGVFDFIPHDGWHIAQTISRAGLVYGSLLLWDSMDGLAWYWRIVGVLGINALTRGIGFSLTYKLLN